MPHALTQITLTIKSNTKTTKPIFGVNFFTGFVQHCGGKTGQDLVLPLTRKVIIQFLKGKATAQSKEKLFLKFNSIKKRADLQCPFQK